MVTSIQARKRQRYHVTIKGNGEVKHVVVIANSPEQMKRLVSKLYNHIIIDDNGVTSGVISFEVTELL
ncbi:hypothetical protein V7266_16265 [Neobacillus drentensis]|uniref:hypothetical protein n=1 Tax=Neobacillus drentensis TaxID=220684 RepID=UPI003000F5EB